MSKISYVIIGLVSIFFISGCVPLIVGAGALGGYAVSKDTIQGDTDNDFSTVWDTAVKVADKMGIVKVQDKKKGSIALTIGYNNVNIKISELTEKATRLRVSCRTKLLLPNITLAQKVFIKIIRQIGE